MNYSSKQTWYQSNSAFDILTCLFCPSLWISIDRPSRTERRVTDRAHPREHNSCPTAPTVVQPPRQQLALSQAAAETGRPAAAGDGARGAGPGDQEDGRRFTPSSSAGDLQRHVLSPFSGSADIREIPLRLGQEIIRKKAQLRQGARPAGTSLGVCTCFWIKHCWGIIKQRQCNFRLMSIALTFNRALTFTRTMPIVL